MGLPVLSEEHLSRGSLVLVFLIAAGFILVAGGFLVSRLATLPEPYGTAWDPGRYSDKEIVAGYASLVAGLGAIMAVASMVILGIFGRELNPQVRRALLVGGGILLIGVGLLFEGRYQYVRYG